MSENTTGDIISRLVDIYNLHSVEEAYLRSMAKIKKEATRIVMLDLLADVPTEFPSLTEVNRRIKLIEDHGVNVCL